jgi:MFS family permease
MYLSAVAAIQISMNYNTSVFPSAVTPLTKAFGIGAQEARTGQMIYLILYSFGCELWAPWSEEFGRWPILQLSMFLINIWQIPCALAPNWGTILVCRALVSSLPSRVGVCDTSIEVYNGSKARHSSQ